MEEVLPDDLLADVLGRLPPSSLAASRCVRKHWCSMIDARRLLRADLLPLRLGAIYCISFDCIERLTYLFAPPSAAHRIPGGCLDFLEHYYSQEAEDHCNGLLLFSDMVANPATRQWVNLPMSPEPSIDDMLGVTVTMDLDKDAHLLYPKFYLVYDPMAESSQHFEVFLIPLLGRHVCNMSIDIAKQEWPPSTLRIHVFSSRRWRWEERSWIRQGEPAGTMADMLQFDCWDRKAVYFRGALYVHCQNHSVMRIALSNDNNKYQMVRSPVTRSKLGAERATFYLGKSEKGVYSALLYRFGFDTHPQFQVWLLNEKNDGHRIHMEWVLKTNINLQPLMLKASLPHNNFPDDGWMVIRDYKELEAPSVVVAHDDDDDFVATDEWDFDNADEIDLKADKDNKVEVDTFPIDFLGFHPYKEIVFFSLQSRTVSYNLNTSKVQHLGEDANIPVGIRTCFPYSPCLLMMGELFENC